LFYVDRKSTVEQAHRRGLSTIDIESLLLEHPDIREAAVHPVASEQGALKATIVLRSGTESSPLSILEWVTARSPDVIDFVEVRDSLPKNPIGKVLKNVLSAEGVTASTWRAPALDVSPEPTAVGEDR
jgi:crotonobetaine/carnitine-CoA ligase